MTQTYAAGEKGRWELNLQAAPWLADGFSENLTVAHRAPCSFDGIDEVWSDIYPENKVTG